MEREGERRRDGERGGQGGGGRERERERVPYLSDKKRLQRYNGFHTYVFKVPMHEFFLTVQVPR